MIILPAIDLLDGECVRLKRGDYGTSRKVAENALDTAKSFVDAGAKWLHVVDLNGAKSGTSENFGIIEKICALGIPVETGGGIRTAERAGEVLSCGVSRVILGSAAAENPDVASECVERFDEKIAVGADAENGIIKTSGWTRGSGKNYLDFCRDMEERGVKTFIVTDIGRDGMLSGVNVEMLSALSLAVSAKIIASGGVASIEDIRKLKEMNLYGAICGKSIYSGTLNLAEALELTDYAG